MKKRMEKKWKKLRWETRKKTEKWRKKKPRSENRKKWKRGKRETRRLGWIEANSKWLIGSNRSQIERDVIVWFQSIPIIFASLGLSLADPGAIVAFSLDSCLRASFDWALENNSYRLPKAEQGLTRIKFFKAEASKLLASRSSNIFFFEVPRFFPWKLRILGPKTGRNQQIAGFAKHTQQWPQIYRE